MKNYWEHILVDYKNQARLPKQATVTQQINERLRPDAHLEGIVDRWYSSTPHGNQAARNKVDTRTKVNIKTKVQSISFGKVAN